MDGGGLTAEQVADRAGVDGAFLAELVAAGIVEPGEEGMYRIGAVRALGRQGRRHLRATRGSARRAARVPLFDAGGARLPGAVG